MEWGLYSKALYSTVTEQNGMHSISAHTLAALKMPYFSS